MKCPICEKPLVLDEEAQTRDLYIVEECGSSTEYYDGDPTVYRCENPKHRIYIVNDNKINKYLQ